MSDFIRPQQPVRYDQDGPSLGVTLRAITCLAVLVFILFAIITLTTS